MTDDDREPRLRRVLRVVARAVGAGLLALVGLAAVLWFSTDLPGIGPIAQPQVTVVTYADGAVLGEVGEKNRVRIPLERVSRDAQQAVLAAEDRNFYEEPGISLRGIARAFWVNLRGGEVLQGGSTITQQYVRAAYLDREQTLARKLREATLAVKLSARLPKDEVLERYLNTVYFGRGAYGIEAAAHTWFAKPAAELTAAEGAVLAALLRSPVQYDPERSPEAARERWRYVLEGMAEQGWLEQPMASVEYPAVRPRTTENALGGPEGYLIAQALEELQRKGFTELDLELGGLVVQTTVERDAQQAAVQASRTLGAAALPDGVYAALVAVEPGTGRILAEYAGPDYVSRPFNSVTQGSAQAGSSFKPYVLAAALRGGISLRTTFDGSSPQTFGDYTVRNFANASYGELDLVEATAKSVNTVYVPLGKRAGLRRVARTAQDLGITTDMSREDSSPTISLGVTAVHPLDQAAAYAALAAQGRYAEPHLVAQVSDRDGEVLYRAEPATRQAIPPEVAADVTYALEQVVERGTAKAAQIEGRDVAGKTGTTNENTAAWFVGYTPQFAAAVAVYSERPDIPLRGFEGVREVTGGTLPARAWRQFAAAALDDEPGEDFPEPAFVGIPEDVPDPTSSPTWTPSPLPPRDDAPYTLPPLPPPPPPPPPPAPERTRQPTSRPTSPEPQPRETEDEGVLFPD